jgi:pentatricopeptide repeat protein
MISVICTICFEVAVHDALHCVVGAAPCRLISALGSGGQWERAVAVLKEMRKQGLTPDVYSYCSAIMACEKCHRWREALSLLDDMKRDGVTPNDYAYSGVIRACAKGR